MAWFAMSYGVAVLGYLAFTAAAGRWLGPSEFGLFMTVLSVTGLLSQVGLMGVHRSGLREASRLRGQTQPEAMSVLRDGVRAISLTTLPVAGLVGGLGAWLAADDESTATRWVLAVIVASLVILTGQQKIWANYARGLGHVRFASMLEGRSGGAIVATLQALLLVLGWKAAPGTGLAGALLAVSLGYAVPVYLARRVVRSHWRTLPRRRSGLLRDLRHAVGRDWRFLSGQVAAQLNLSVEIWIAAALLSRVDTSMYSSGQRVALLLLLPFTAMQVVFAPAIARMAVESDRARLQRLLRTGATVAVVVTVLLALPMVVVPGLVLEVVFGPGFDDAVPVLVLLSLAFCGNVATGMSGTTLSMMGREGVAARVQWGGAVLRVLLGVPAAWFNGLMGLTLSATVVSVLVFTAMWWSTRRAVGIYTHATVRPTLGLLRRTVG